MKPIKGLVHSSSRGKLTVKLENGETVQFQKREGLYRGDSVLIGYNFEDMKYGHIIRDEHTVLQEKHEPSIESEEIHEDSVERSQTPPMFEVSEVSLTDLVDEEYEVCEDTFEDLRFLLQGSEDI